MTRLFSQIPSTRNLIVVLFCVMCVICVLCLIAVPLPPGKYPFAVKINNNTRKGENGLK
jgi:hypothetical protein